MINLQDLKREAAFLARQPQFVAAIIVLFLLSGFSVWSGHSEIRSQHDTIARLLEKDETDRKEVQAKQSDFGGAAYYTFHLTWSEPSSLAFAAIGERDVFPWKHRVRMLALEGQIYETDADNPELSYLGRFDFAFLISILLPLFMILMLHDLRTSEREAGRFDLLVITAHKEKALWLSRALIIIASMVVAVVVPFVFAAVINQADLTGILNIVAVVLGNIIIWSLIILGIGAAKSMARFGSAQLASILLSIWLVFSVIIPVSSDALLRQFIQSPTGGEIVLTQREAVNDAWDLPFSTTWEAFLETHPKWKDKTAMDSLFEWKWYYAFQQVGDEKAQGLSNAYRQATVKKQQYASYIALLSPTLLSQQLMTRFAKTDAQSLLAYEDQVRQFHGELRQFYYPLLFNDVEFSREKLEALPEFQPDAAVR